MTINIMQDEPDPISTYDSILEDLDDIILNAIQKKKSKRYESCNEFKIVLENAAEYLLNG